MFKNTKEIINTLETAIEIFGSTNSALNREKAKLMVVASRHALQALALDFAERRFPVDATKIIEVKYESSRPSQTNGHKESNTKRISNKARRLG